MHDVTVFENLAEEITYSFINHLKNSYHVIDYWEHRHNCVIFLCESQSRHLRRQVNHKLEGSGIIHIQVQSAVRA